jgi:phosphoserine phosphatase RsbU/P
LGEGLNNLGGARILVVDDDENNRDMLSRRLERRGMSAQVAVDGPSALGALARSPFDLVLLDIEMPGMNGLDVLRQVRQTHTPMQLPVIIATARNDREDVVEALSLGANDYVTKPLDFQVVFARVQTQLAHKLAVSRIVQLEADVRRRNLELEQANLRMKHSLGLAAKIQRSLLPSEPVKVAGLQFAWLYEPCDELGGDILGLFPVGPRQVAMYVLDVSGHGVPAALLSVTLNRMLAPVPGRSSLVQKSVGTGLEPRPPRDVAEELNRRFQMYGWDGQYFTLFYGVMDVVERRLRYVSCGHPPGLVLPRSGRPRFLDCHNLAMGWFPDAVFDEDVVEFAEGDRFYIYSDGVNETMTASGDQFGYDRLAAACENRREGPIDQTLVQLLAELNQFRAGAPVRDDVSALGMELCAAATASA